MVHTTWGGRGTRLFGMYHPNPPLFLTSPLKYLGYYKGVQGKLQDSTGLETRRGTLHLYTIEMYTWPLIKKWRLYLYTMRLYHRDLKVSLRKLCLFWLCTAGHWRTRSRDPTYEREYSTVEWSKSRWYIIHIISKSTSHLYSLWRP